MTAEQIEAQATLLSKVRKLLTKAEAEGVTTAEAESYTAKAAELMAKYGIDRALLAKLRPETDKPSDRKIECENPWGRVKAHLLCGLGSAMRCQAVILASGNGSTRIHLFGFESDLERVDVLYTSLLLQMTSALQAAERPGYVRSVRAWNRSYLLGFASAVVARVRTAEASAVQEAKATTAGTGTDLVLADRKQVISQRITIAYPKTRKTKMTYSGSGYGAGYTKGQQANIGQTGVGRGGQRSLTG
jgi:hypothetical protein